KKNVFSRAAMIGLCCRMGSHEKALLGFNEMHENGFFPDNFVIPSALKTFSASQMIGFGKGVHGYALKMGACICNMVKDALDSCRLMRSENFGFDSVTLTTILSASTEVRNLELGKECHGYCIRNNFDSDVVVANSIIEMYGKCENTDKARRVFEKTIQKDLTLWNTLIAAYAESGLSGEALKLFYQMQLEGVPPNVVSWNSVILGFLRNGQVTEAETIFSEMQCMKIRSNLITWTSLISGLAQNGHGDRAIRYFKEMQIRGLQPNTSIHGYIILRQLFSSLSIVTSLVDMYAKCGNLYLARKFYDMVNYKELPIYSAMISGYSSHGQSGEAFEVFKRMQNEKIKPDEITFTGLLSACDHAGLVEKGLKVFNDMISEYRMKPSMHHYGCMVSLLSRCGRFFLEMPLEPDAQISGSILSACKEQNKVELGEYLSQYLFKLEPDNSGNYVALSITNATAGRWDGMKC
ncbi:hypothetical protein MKW92_015424, partial [Papaver armeniacum]